MFLKKKFKKNFFKKKFFFLKFFFKKSLFQALRDAIIQILTVSMDSSQKVTPRNDRNLLHIQVLLSQLFYQKLAFLLIFHIFLLFSKKPRVFSYSIHSKLSLLRFNTTGQVSHAKMLIKYVLQILKNAKKVKLPCFWSLYAFEISCIKAFS